jgi:hypothetical protein
MDADIPPRKTSPGTALFMADAETMPGSALQTETIAITQGHLLYNAESRPQRRSPI